MVFKKVINQIAYKVQKSNKKLKQVLDTTSSVLDKGADLGTRILENPITQELLLASPYGSATNRLANLAIGGAKQLADLTNRSSYSGNVNKVSGNVLEKAKALNRTKKQVMMT
jgi:hypothetical protein